MQTHRSILLALCVAVLAGCCARPPTADAASVQVAGKVTDVAGFEQFIASRPTPAQFRQRYPDVLLVVPGDVATKELRMDKSRYFAELDGQQRIVGGAFR